VNLGRSDPLFRASGVKWIESVENGASRVAPARRRASFRPAAVQ
jgi:hypothetical protein